MEFGIFSNGERGNQLAADTFDEDMFEVVVADRLGMTEAWISEHPWLPKRPDVVCSADMFIVKAAAITEQIKLGPAVRPIAIYHPLQVAMDAAMADQLTRGRYMFGFGSGDPAIEGMTQRGLGPKDPELLRARMREALDLILRCWDADEPFDYEGAFWQGKGIHPTVKPYQSPHMPIGVAATRSGGTAELAGRHGFFPIFSQYDEPEHIHDLSEAFVAGCRAAGREPHRTDIRACRSVWVSDTTEQAKEELRPSMAPYVAALRPILGRRLGPDVTLDWDWMVDSGFYFVGDPDRVAQLIMRHYEASGGFGTLLLITGKDYGTREQRERSMRLFMDEVAPRLRGLAPD